MPKHPKIVVAGAGIGGLVTALSLHDAGFDVHVYEATEELRALGVGINLLPHAVRELDALGLLERLAESSVAPTTLAYFSKHGTKIWSEPRGIAAGYRWPQLSIHRGTLQTILLEAVVERLGADRVWLGHRLEGFASNHGSSDSGIEALFVRRQDQALLTVEADALIAADGIHSVARRQLLPNEGAPKWNGALLWRGLVEHAPVLDGRTMIWAGHPDQKFVGYPILDLANGNQLFNFIAELRSENRTLADKEDWNKAGELADFVPRFESWIFDWLDVPALIRRAPGTFLFPMIDRDPVSTWTFGRMTLLGDAAHPMYPIGSNGASQAILDARVLTGCLRCHADDVDGALAHYDEIRRPATGAIVLANRGMGPELPMQLVEQRAPQGFTEINDVITPDEILAVTEGYRTTAGFALSALAEGTSLADRDYSAR